MASIQLGVFTPFLSLPNSNILESDGIQMEYRRGNGDLSVKMSNDLRRVGSSKEGEVIGL